MIKYLLVALIVMGGLMLQSDPPQAIYPSDAVVDSMIRDWYENGWFAEHYMVGEVTHINITNVSSYGRYQYEAEPAQYLMGVAYTVHVGYRDTRTGTQCWHPNNCFLFYNAEDKWYIEAVPFLPLIDERTSPNVPRSKI